MTLSGEEKLNNRNFIGFEISKEYCEIAEKRIQNIAFNEE